MIKHLLKKKLAGITRSLSGELTPFYRYTWFDNKGRIIGENVDINMIDKIVLKHLIVDNEITHESKREEEK